MSAGSDLAELTFFAHSGEVRRGDLSVMLTRPELDIFDSLHDAYPRFKTREAIFDDAYGLRREAEEPDPKIVDVHLVNLRKKLRQLSVSIENRWGFGWRLQIDPLHHAKKGAPMKNRITDLNDHLFAQMERLADEGLSKEKLEAEVQRTEAMVKVADTIVDNARLGIQAATMVANHGDRFRKDLPMLAAPMEIDGK